MKKRHTVRLGCLSYTIIETLQYQLSIAETVLENETSNIAVTFNVGKTKIALKFAEFQKWNGHKICRRSEPTW